MSLLQVFYASQVAGEFGVPQARRLVGEAQVLNRRAGITGLLTFTGAYFAQVLEGPAEVVDPLLARIARDRRHAAFRVLQRQPIVQREFPGWHMALLESPQLEVDLAALVHPDGPVDDAVAAALVRIRRDVGWQTVSDLPGGPSPLPLPQG